MIVDLQHVVGVVLMLLLAAGVFGLLIFLVNYVGGQFPGEGAQLFVKAARIVLVVLAVLFLIGLLMSFAGVGPEFRWGTTTTR